MKAQAAGKHDFLDVLTLTDHVDDTIVMANARNVLIDDGAGIEILCHIVTGRSNQFYSTLRRLMVRASARKSWQKTVMNVGSPP